MQLINIYWYVSFGTWSLSNYFALFKSDTCSSQMSLLSSVYNIALVVGAFPALVLLVATLIGCITIPCMCIGQLVSRCLRARR
jgi:hypothetical protein